MPKIYGNKAVQSGIRKRSKKLEDMTLLGNQVAAFRAGLLGKPLPGWAPKKSLLAQSWRKGRDLAKKPYQIEDGEWYFYQGGELPTTRCFCEARVQKYFYYKQIEAFGRGEDLGECRSGDLWAGANRNTNEQSIFLFAGGWNCGHSWILTSIFDVPKEVVQNAIDKFGYE